ncbi:MAG: imelysin family protein [Arcicella sp.]|jgi:hypothetical protein|nr:imelysin family protein [Arcicella sp.]
MKKRLLFTLIILSTFACNKPADEVKQEGFDRKLMLTNYYDNLILPAFTTLETSTISMETAIKTLASTPTEGNLLAAQKAWEDTYLVWLKANAYNFGPTGEDGIKKGIAEEIGIFPVSESKIEANISSNKLTFNDFNRDNRGFLAVEYLIFDKAALNKLQVQNRRNYLLAVTENLKGFVTEAKKGWGAYKTDFVNKNGTDAGSSTSQLYNEFVKSYEAMKNFKLGLPLGLRAGQTQAEPTKVEGFYSGKSLKFIEAHFTTIENIYYGRGSADGLGFKEYLETVEGGKNLIASTEAQIAVIKNTLKAIPQATPMAEQIVKSPQGLVNLQTEMQKQTRFFKSDMSSVLGIAITFSSGDGD